METRIRSLESRDFSQAADIARLAFNTPYSRLNELIRLVSFQPDGWFLAELSGESAGMVGAVDYGPFASIGMMVVHPNYQRMGIGRRLMEAIVQWIDARGCPAMILEATALGKPLYASLGFQPVDNTIRTWYTPGAVILDRGNSRAIPVTLESLHRLFAFDLEMFGADRSRVLARFMEEFPQRSFLTFNPGGDVDGYVICSQKQIGPWVSLNVDSARSLMVAALGLDYEEAPAVIIPAANQPGVTMLEEFGFGGTKNCTHMVRGLSGSPVRREFIYGEASFALG